MELTKEEIIKILKIKEKHECKICGERFRYEKNLKEHMKEIHE